MCTPELVAASAPQMACVEGRAFSKGMVPCTKVQSCHKPAIDIWSIRDTQQLKAYHHNMILHTLRTPEYEHIQTNSNIACGFKASRKSHFHTYGQYQ